MSECPSSPPKKRKQGTDSQMMNETVVDDIERSAEALSLADHPRGAGAGSEGREKSAAEGGARQRHQQQQALHVHDLDPDLEALISNARYRKQSQLGKLVDALPGRCHAEDLDLNHLLRQIQAILSTNAEIWERCRWARCGESEGRSSSSSPPGGGGAGGLCFKRIAYTKISVFTKTVQCGHPSWSSKSQLLFEARATRSIESFGMPEPLPSHLGDVVTPRMTEPEGIFVDYDHFLETAFLLDEEVLVPFLACLKEHLEGVQVFLGRINGWVREQEACAAYIEENFDFGPLDVSDEIMLCGRECKERHDDAAVCNNCGRTYAEHKTDSTSYSTDGKHVCPGWGSKQRGSFPLSCSRPVLLKCCDVSGEHKDSFDIGEDGQKERLKRFLAFVSYVEPEESQF